MFLPHSLLLRGTFLVMWRENKRALADLDNVINMQGVSDMVSGVWSGYKMCGVWSG